MSLSEKVKTFPRKPGVYLFKNAKGEVLYVGKAIRLRDRVRSYFQKGRDERPQIEFLVKRTRDVEFIVTDSEKEALLLENTLIKKHRPRYNLHLRDDKSYVSIRLSDDHEYPGISITRKVKGDDASYFGPYDSSLAAREAVDQITRFFKIRTCKDREFANRIRPCLKYDIGRCSAPCVGKVVKDDYDLQVEEVLMFLSGRSSDLIRRLKLRMKESSGRLDYEDASRYRDAVTMLKSLIEKQKVVKHGGGDHDAIGIASDDGDISICILKVRRGLLIDKRIFHSHSSIDERSHLVEELLLVRYKDGEEIPPKILVPTKPDGVKSLSEILKDRRGSAVLISNPKKGAMYRLVQLAETNAAEALLVRASSKGDEEILSKFSKRIGLVDRIESVECVDISNLGGRDAVGSVVSFFNGKPNKNYYRIYNIRSLSTPDDYGMMHEVLKRRFDEHVDRALPDLMMVDGGKGQLAVAERVLSDLSIPISIASIAKPKDKKDIDRIFIPGRKNPLSLKKGSKELLLLMRIRDEAHRFGVSAHRRLRSKKTLSSPLDNVAGLGPKLKKRLFDQFKDLDGIKNASFEDISEVKGVSGALVKKIKLAIS
ncbi:MAG: excinuclease ABC subunit UvrC [Deltaproteobacteria bacterium]|jgi:excinuclease ABC subunit C|nr:excinuclease ABC subunit UvrC [Deltaproteobacteria bacterium]